MGRLEPGLGRGDVFLAANHDSFYYSNSGEVRAGVEQFYLL